MSRKLVDSWLNPMDFGEDRVGMGSPWEGSTASTSTAVMPSHRLGMLLHCGIDWDAICATPIRGRPPRSARSRITGARRPRKTVMVFLAAFR
jgi:hypothetical protein